MSDLKRARDDFSSSELFVRPEWWNKITFNPNTPDENTAIYAKGEKFWHEMQCPLCRGGITVDKSFLTSQGASESNQVHEFFCNQCVVADKFGKDDTVKLTKRYKKILYPELPQEILQVMYRLYIWVRFLIVISAVPSAERPGASGVASGERQGCVPDEGAKTAERTGSQDRAA